MEPLPLPKAKKAADHVAGFVERELEVEDLTNALSDFVPSDPASAQRLKAVVEALAKSMPDDLRQVPQEQLAATDTVAQTRRLYVAALLRLWDVIARPAHDWEQLESQGRIALAYVRHVETNQRVFQMGKTRGDEQLAENVADLRKKFQDLSARKARFIKDESQDAEVLTETPTN